MNGSIPPHIDSCRLVDHDATLEGVCAFVDTSRVCEQPTGDADEVRVRVFFGYSHQKLAIMYMQLGIEVSVVCQRCLDTATISVRGEYTHVIFREDQSADDLPKGCDALEVGEEPLDLLALVEDELLLALPTVPTHGPKVCQHPAGFVVRDKPEPGEVEDKYPSPFGVLA